MTIPNERDTRLKEAVGNRRAQLRFFFVVFLTLFFADLVADFFTLFLVDFLVDFTAVFFATLVLDVAFLADFFTDFFTDFLADFFTDFLADFAGCDFLLTGPEAAFFLADFFVAFFAPAFLLLLEPPPKADAQPSEYLSFVPTRRIVIVSIASER